MRKKIIIGILLFSGLVFAAAQTKYYGDILMQGHKILGLATDASDSTSATTKGYVDAELATKLPLSGGSSKPMTGNLYMGTSGEKHQIKNLASPSSDYDAANKYWVANTFLPKSGGNVTGTIDMNFHPLINPATNNIAWNSVVHRQYVNQEDNKVARTANAAVTNLAANVDAELATKLPLSGGDMVGDINMTGHKINGVLAPTTDYEAANKNYVDTEVAASSTNAWKGIYKRLKLSGGTLSGDINMGSHRISGLATPANDYDAATAEYVKGYVDPRLDLKLNKAGGTMTGDITMSNGKTVKGLPMAPSLDSDAAAQGLVRYYFSQATNYAGGKLSVDGGALYGNLSMGGHRVTGLYDPEHDFDGANKRYVDNEIAGAIINANYYQYFALKQGTGYTPLYNVASTTNRYFDVVVLREFTGAITSYVESADAKAGKRYSSQTWKVGSTIKVPFSIDEYAYYRTNGTLIIKGPTGIVGNFGVIFPSRSISPASLVCKIGTHEYRAEQSANVSDDWDAGYMYLHFQMKNVSGRTISAASFAFSQAKKYTNTGTLPTSVKFDDDEVFTPVDTGYNPVKVNWANNATIDVYFRVSNVDVNNGMKFDFVVIAEGMTFNFGQFYIPAVL